MFSINIRHILSAVVCLGLMGFWFVVAAYTSFFPGRCAAATLHNIKVEAPDVMAEEGERLPLFLWTPDLRDGGYWLQDDEGRSYGWIRPAFNRTWEWRPFTHHSDLIICPVPAPQWPSTFYLKKGAK